MAGKALRPLSEGKLWSLEELRVLAAIFSNAAFAIGDDNRSECRAIADAFGRTPGSVDRQWRNMAAVARGSRAGNIGKLVVRAVQDHLFDPLACTRAALIVCESRGWKLRQLVLEGTLGEELEPAPQGERAEILRALRGFAGDLAFKVFSSGSQGFFRQGKIALPSGARYQAQITAVLIGSKRDSLLSPLAAKDDVGFALLDVLDRVDSKVFQSGRAGFYGHGKVAVASERYQVAIQAVQIGVP